jgi:hypothetical protein
MYTGACRKYVYEATIAKLERVRRLLDKIISTGSTDLEK